MNQNSARENITGSPGRKTIDFGGILEVKRKNISSTSSQERQVHPPASN